MFLDIRKDIYVKSVFIENRYICLRLQNETEFRFPASKNTKLSKATDKELSNVELICDSTGLHWEDLDEDLSISGVIEGNFGF